MKVSPSNKTELCKLGEEVMSLSNMPVTMFFVSERRQGVTLSSMLIDL